MVEIVDEGPFLAVGEHYPDHAEPAGEGGVLLLDHLTRAPSKIMPVFHFVAYFEVQPLSHFLYYNKIHRCL